MYLLGRIGLVNINEQILMHTNSLRILSQTMNNQTEDTYSVMGVVMWALLAAALAAALAAVLVPLCSQPKEGVGRRMEDLVRCFRLGGLD